MGERLPEPCPGCGEHHEVEDVQALEGPFSVILFVRPDGSWRVDTTMDQLSTLSVLNTALRQASADLS